MWCLRFVAVVQGDWPWHIGGEPLRIKAVLTLLLLLFFMLSALVHDRPWKYEATMCAQSAQPARARNVVVYNPWVLQITPPLCLLLLLFSCVGVVSVAVFCFFPLVAFLGFGAALWIAVVGLSFWTVCC